jgi:hypothetical protein
MSELHKFAADSKLIAGICNDNDVDTLREDLQKLEI